MQKLILSLLLVFVSFTQSKAQQRLFDQDVQLKTCNISIEADPFIATTVIEMEFYNPKDQEVEGLHRFQLNRGQVITDFQLELNGKYREGSIEERWKARQAYSSIVGKRIDPALLQMNGYNNYSINIYPIAAHSSRKVKFTITQMMEEENLRLTYTLPLQLKTVTPNFKLDIKVNRPASIPYANKGILDDQLFNMKNEEALLSQQVNGIILDRPISFSVSQFNNKPQFCINRKNGVTGFLMRFYPDAPRYNPGKPKLVNVYWDVSLSGKGRDLQKEIDFLELYISENGINKANIFLFNHQMQGIIVFERGKENFSSIRNYLLTYKYNGATELGNLNFSNVMADAVLVFSDGINSVGYAQPKTGAVPVSFITTIRGADYALAEKIIGSTGGSLIRLENTDIKQAVRRTDTIENFLFKYTATNIHLNEPFPIRLGGSILLSGSISQSDNLELFYGNNSAIQRSENYFLNVNEHCDETTFRKMQMLRSYDSLLYTGYKYWQDMVVFGLTEKVVTPQTSYLVLERIEDYINYNIAPPKDLEEECAARNYVYRPEYKIKALRTFTEKDNLDAVVKEYNKRVSWWSRNEAPIDLDKVVVVQQNTDVAANNEAGASKPTAPAAYYQNNSLGIPGSLNEVVVTSAYGVKRSARSTSSNVQVVSNEQLNIIRQANVNEALAGKVAGLQVRSQSYAKLGAETLLRLRGENSLSVGKGPAYVLDGTVLSSALDVNINDIEDITVLQGPAAAVLFGSEASNGAIVMTSKKARRGAGYGYYVWGEYKLKTGLDVGYMLEIQKAEPYEQWDTFLALEKEYKMDIGFYFEMANFFFEKRKTVTAQALMLNAIELCQGNSSGLKLAAYMYEEWKQFDKAIAIYKGILSRDEQDVMAKRDLALAYFQHGDFETAVRTYHALITAADESGNNVTVKNQALAEMNAILAMHKNEFDISYINPNLLKLLPVDLRITVESNQGNLSRTQFIEPGGAVCSNAAEHTKSGGRYGGTDYNYGRYSNAIQEYTIKNATAGRYGIKVDAYGGYTYAWSIPRIVRVVSFKNFQGPNMKMNVELFDLDNQYGIIELDGVQW